jgi:hypothetical protein
MRLWQRQPDEAPADFTAFVAYLRLKGRRSHLAVATQTGRSLGAIRRLSAHFNWAGRVAAFEARRADAAQDALDSMVRACANQTRADYERLRVAQFQLAHRIHQESSRWLALAADPRRRNISLAQVCRIIALASKLGRLACGLPTGDAPKRRPRPEDTPGYWTGPTLEEAIQKIYGSEMPAAASAARPEAASQDATSPTSSAAPPTTSPPPVSPSPSAASTGGPATSAAPLPVAPGPPPSPPPSGRRDAWPGPFVELKALA